MNTLKNSIRLSKKVKLSIPMYKCKISFHRSLKNLANYIINFIYTPVHKHIAMGLFFIILGIFFMYPVSICSQTLLSLNNAIEMALKNNSKYAQSREKENESKLKINEVWGKLWPDLSIDASRTAMNTAAGLNQFIAGEEDVHFIKGTLTINPGAFYESLQASRDGYIISVNDERRIKAETVMKTIELFDQYFLACETVVLISNSFNALKANLKIVTTGYDTGTGLSIDVLRAKVSLANQKARLIMAVNTRRNAAITLNLQIGNDWDTKLKIDQASIRINDTEIQSYTNMANEHIKAVLEKFISEALINRPEIMQVEFKKKEIEHTMNANKFFYLCPSIFISASYGTSKLNEKTSGSFQSVDPATLKLLGPLMPLLSPSGWNNSWTFTIGASYRFGSLAPWDSAHVKTKELKSQVEQADFEMEDLLKNIRQDVILKFNKLVSAAGVIPSQKENVGFAEKYFFDAITQFNNGIIDNSKLLSADIDLQNAKTLYLQALYDFQISKAELNKAIGIDLFNF